eukprot:2895581-Rhodomonas_salina.2
MRRRIRDWPVAQAWSEYCSLVSHLVAAYPTSVPQTSYKEKAYRGIGWALASSVAPGTNDPTSVPDNHVQRA